MHLAATFLDDAIQCRHVDFCQESTKIYAVYKIPYLRYVLYFAFALLISLAFFEEPTAIFTLPSWATLSLEFVCLLVFMSRLFHEMMVFEKATTFWKDTKHITNTVIIFVTLIDICVYASLNENGLRVTRPLRPFLLVNFTEARQIRRAFRTIRRSLPELGNVLILFLASVTLFALMAVKLFERLKLDKGRYFTDFFDSFWHLYVLVTTANSPDIMMPAYNENGLYILFFVAFLLVNLYLFMRVFLAVIYKSYKDNLKAEVHEAIKLKRDLLRQCYDNVTQMSKNNFKVLMNLALPSKNEEYFEVAWLILQEDDKDVLSYENFSNVLDLIGKKYLGFFFQ